MTIRRTVAALMLGPLAAGLLMGATLATPEQAAAAPAATIADSPTDEVYDVAVGADGTTYAVGAFNQAGAATGGLALLDDQTALVDRSFFTVNGRVRDSIVDANGATYISGDFITVGGVPRQGLARLNADGTLDPDWAPVLGGPNDTYNVSSLALDDTALFIAGTFTSVSGQARTNLAAVDTVTGEALPWAPNPNFGVMSLAADDTHVYVGGYFTTIASTSRSYIAAFTLADLSFDAAWNPAPTGAIDAITPANGLVYLGGGFSQIGSTPVTRNRLAAVDANTAAVTNWNPSVNGSGVDALVIDDTVAYIGGNFQQVNGQTRRSAAAVRLDDTGTLTAFSPDLGYGTVPDFLVDGSHVYIAGGYYTVFGNPWNSIARFDSTTGAVDTSWAPRAPDGGDVSTITRLGDSILVGGGFTHMNVVAREGAAAFDTDMRLTTWDPVLYNGEGYAIDIAGSTAYVVGYFNTVNGSVTRDYAAAFRTDDTGTVTSWDPQPDSYPYDLEIVGNLAYMGGDFGDIGGYTRNHAGAVRIDDTGSVNAFDPDLDGAPLALDVEGDTVYFVGEFNNINGNVPRVYVGAARTSDGQVTDWDPLMNGSVGQGIAVSDGIAYIVGDFSAMNGSIPRRNAAAVSVDDTGTVTPWDPDLDNPVSDVVLHGSSVYLAGDFSLVNGNVPRGGLAAVSLDTGVVSPDWIPQANGSFQYSVPYEGTLRVDGNRLLVGGSFIMATLDGQDYPGGLAALPVLPVPNPSPAPQPEPVPATAPRDVQAVAGNASAVVDWTAPASSGSYPVSTYLVSASPSGRSCLAPAPATSCDVTGLSNGTSYTFTVRALTGAGWSASSEPSNAVTPRAVALPSITITGSRAGERIEISGSTTGLRGPVTPWTSKSLSAFAPGRAVALSRDGSLAWSRRASTAVVWRVYFTAEQVRSNSVTIR